MTGLGATEPPPIAAQTVRDAFAQSYGIGSLDCCSLGGELNQTYAVTADDDVRYVVKVSAQKETDDLRWQHTLLDAFVHHPFVRAPRVVRDRHGSDVVPVVLAQSRRTMTAYEWLPGRILADLPDHTDQLLDEWGRLAGHLVLGLADLRPGAAVRATHEWNLMNAPALLRAAVPALTDPEQVADVRTALDWFATIVEPRRRQLPSSVVHQDLNDYNVLADVGPTGEQHICGVIDFADALFSARVTEVAIAAGYAMLRKTDPLSALITVTRGFAAIAPLDDAELEVLYPLAVARLALNAATWTARKGGPADAYGRARSQHTWTTLAALLSISPATAESAIRRALLSARNHHQHNGTENI